MKKISKLLAANYLGKISAKTFVFSATGFTIILCILYTNYMSNFKPFNRYFLLKTEGGISHSHEICPKLIQSKADIDTVEVFKYLEFESSRIQSKYWDQRLEVRYQEQIKDPERPFLKVIIVPHSHNDPGWLETFEDYFDHKSRHIINNMLVKLKEYKELTFIWSEVIFLNAWWERAHPSQQSAFKDLVKAGRIEITTGGWVMIDEANTHIYAMVDQLIEGHQWLWSNLGIKPKCGWSIDPFGHGSTHPYLLAQAGFNATVIQRIHYAWKQWLALKQFGDFRWIPNWSPSSASGTIITHNQPFDFYTTQQCGPDQNTCENFDFSDMKNRGVDEITDENVKLQSEVLLEQYARTGSFYTHNVVLTPLGGDFQYTMAENFDEQYLNYIKIINYINANRDKYRTEITFGTPSDYFKEILKRNDQFPSLRGDFFVYADWSSNVPAYWSGYFTTRPYMKRLARELESSLRGAEILYTIALNYARQKKLLSCLKNLEDHYGKLVRSRRSLGLFQHHDAITGTSKSAVMRDYGLKLFQGILDTVTIQQSAIGTFFLPSITFKPDDILIFSDMERESYEKLPKKIPITVSPKQTRKIILYNSLVHEQEHVIQVRTTTFNVKVLDNDDREVIHQINPVWKLSKCKKELFIHNKEFQVIFIAKIPQLSLVTYKLVFDTNIEDNLANIHCNKCRDNIEALSSKNNLSADALDIKIKLKIEGISKGDIHLENNQMRLVFNEHTGFMKTFTRKQNSKIIQCAIQFGAYKSSSYNSGAYLFAAVREESQIEMHVLEEYKDQINIVITSGPVLSEIAIIYGPLLIHTVSLYHIENSTLSNGIFIENTVDFEKPPKNSNTELFMRVSSNIQNGVPPEFYSDLNGFQIQKRVKVEKLNIEGNYYPITSMAFIQDENTRLSIITNHAQGAASWQTGHLEVMLDRRIPSDDLRGLGEGVTDNRRTIQKFCLLIEDIKADHSELLERSVEDLNLEKDDPPRVSNPTNRDDYQRPSLYANRISNLLNYPVGIFPVDQNYQGDLNRSIQLLNKPFSSDLHLLTLRTQPNSIYSQYPSSSAFLVLHRQSCDCKIGHQVHCDRIKISVDTSIQYAEVEQIEAKLLSGVEALDEKLYKLSDIILEPMSLKTINITFS